MSTKKGEKKSTTIKIHKEIAAASGTSKINIGTVSVTDKKFIVPPLTLFAAMFIFDTASTIKTPRLPLDCVTSSEMTDASALFKRHAHHTQRTFWPAGPIGGKQITIRARNILGPNYNRKD